MARNKTEELANLEKAMNECDESIEKQSGDATEQGEVLKTARTTMKEAEETYQASIATAEQEAKKHQTMLHELAQKKIEAVSLKDEWKALKREIAIDELYAKQPDVWDVIPKRLKLMQEQHDSNLVDIDERDVDLDAVCTTWRDEAEGKTGARAGFSHWHVDIRNMAHSYRKAVKDVCEASVDKRQITVDARTLPNRIIDNWIRQPQQMARWCK